jgi:hypothetical protein
MSKVKITGHASGSGTLTLSAPNTSSDRTITLPDATCTLADNSDVTTKLPLAGGTMTGDLILGDNVSLEIGSGTNGDLQIYHNGTHSTIDSKTGDLEIRTNALRMYNQANNEALIKGDADGEVQLFHNGVEKFNTTATGIDVTGTITDDSPFFFIRSTAGQSGIADNVWTKVTLGTEDIDTAGACSSSRFTVPSGGAGIYYISANIYCNSEATGNLYTGQANIRKNGSETYIKVENNNNDGYPYTQGVFLGGYLNLAEGDYIELYGAMNILDNSTGTFNNHCFMSGGRIG